MRIDIPGFDIDKYDRHAIVMIGDEINVYIEYKTLHIDMHRGPDVVYVERCRLTDTYEISTAFQTQCEYSAEFIINIIEKYMVLVKEQIYI